MSELGTLAWGERSGGRLTTRECVRLALQGAVVTLREKLPRREMPSVRDVRAPDGALAKRVETLLAACAPPWLVNHCQRTFVWASALAERDGLRPDVELLYAASLLHDLGLTSRYAPENERCFAIAGAAAALEELTRAGVPEPRARIVAEAIALHMNLVVDGLRHGPEAYLLRAATALDVVGQSAGSLPRAFRETTLTAFPRLRLKEEVLAVMTERASACPSSRLGFYCRVFSFPARVRAAPFRE